MKKSAITAIIAIVLVFIFTAGGVVGNMLGLFSKGNSVEYSPKQCTLEESSLYGKKIIFLGSSVTYGYCSLGDSFVDYLEHQYGVVPIKEAPFPQISNKPKYSPDFSGGIILAK